LNIKIQLSLVKIFLIFLIFSPILKAKDLDFILEKNKINQESYTLYIKNIQSGEVWEKDSTAQFNFASVNKILTASVALDVLGPEFRFKTKFFTKNKPNDNGHINDLIIKGEGDPTITAENILEIFKNFKYKGIHQIDGNIIFDNSYFENFKTPLIDNSIHRAYNVAPKALIVEAGSIELEIQPEEREILVFHKPRLGKIIVENKLILKNEKCNDWKSKIYPRYTFENDQMTITLNGSFSKLCGIKNLYLNALDQDKYLELIIKNILEKTNIVFNGKFIINNSDALEDSNNILIYEHNSKYLSQLMYEMNKFSLNLFSRNISLVAMRESGTFYANEFNLDLFYKNWIKDKNIYIDNFYLQNGAGLSRSSYADAQFFGQLLFFIDRSNFESELKYSLPIAGTDGTLKKIFKDKHYSKATRLKTGRLKDVFSLAGYLKSKSGEEYIIVFALRGKQYQKSLNFIDEILDFLYKTT
jgi:D-alanyl-D-alanine carboxypeptidase/D-alanyl-D-alanine-endopeptidase (penicillin-binding protein 4)